MSPHKTSTKSDLLLPAIFRSPLRLHPRDKGLRGRWDQEALTHSTSSPDS